MSAWTLVTGGAKGLGAELCLALASKGYPVVIHYRSSQDQAEQVAKACRELGVAAEIIQGDFSTRDQVESFLNDYQTRFPETVNLINNVGDYLVKSALTTTPDEWIHLFQTNLYAPWTLIQSLLPSMKKTQGSIINLGFAGLETLRADIHATAYSMTKTGLLLLTKSLAKELASFQVRVNMVSPGYLENSVDLPVLEKIPMGRLGELREVSRVVLFLLNQENRYITGQNIEVAGGVRL